MKTRLSIMPLTCILTILAAGAWGLHAATPQSATPAPVNAIIDASKTFTPINPNLYGMFIEHAGGLVYAGMWSEMIDDRKFYNPSPPRTRLRPGRHSREYAAVAAASVLHLGPGFPSVPRNSSLWTPGTPSSATTLQ